MNSHEYQAKQHFATHGVPVPQGQPATSAAGARKAAETLGGEEWVIKAQVHVGGRGKAGGVVVTKELADVETEAARLLGSRLTTKQTGPEGLPVNMLLIEVPSAAERELYLSLLVDRARKRGLLMASAEGDLLALDAKINLDDSALYRHSAARSIATG